MEDRDSKDFKETLNLPKTDFPMRANLPQKEPEILAKWEKERLYYQLRHRLAHRPKYILHDGPPYANGHIHMGHALNKILKDIIVKIKNMEGYNAVYVPGWDCHGLPIEQQIELQLGERKRETPKREIRRLCREFANKYIDIQRTEFQRLGILGDWDNPYLTMDYKYQADIIRQLGIFMDKGNLYKGLKPVHWCPNCQTALAEAEVEYEEHKSPSIYVKFPLKDSLADKYPSLESKQASIVIWTTTPWTLPANLAIALHPDYEYVALGWQDEVLIIAKELIDSVIERFATKNYKLLVSFRGYELEGLKCQHPLYPRESLVITGEHVTLEQGTGCVHTAPGHGQEDYEIGIKYGLEIYAPVDDRGYFVETLPQFGGMRVFEANTAINQTLAQKGYLLSQETLVHSYPHCWRCKNPIIFRATPQWFISLEKNGLRQLALEEINRVEWIPAWGQARIYGMVENRPDWCVSRQRAWGVPIAVVYCQDCNQPLTSKEVADYIADLVEKEGADIWFERETKELLPPNIRCPGCGSERFVKEEDILDVWFDSGSSQAAVLPHREDLVWPADMYLEGSDQHRGWFQSSLLVAVGTRGKAPYKTVLTHGYVVDGEGKKMSKSLGNVIAPQDIIKRYGAEILRLWVSSENYREDIRISQQILQRLVEAYRRIRNTCRFILGNLYDFDPQNYRPSYSQLPELDRLILHRLQKLIGKIRKAYHDHEYHVFYHAFHNFCTVDLSAFYLDIIKDRLYILKPDSEERRAAQYTLWQVILAMVKLMAPVLSFTAEEVWQYLPAKDQREASVHLTEFPQVDTGLIDDELASRWDKLLEVRGEVTRALEIARKEKKIGNSLDAQVDLYLPPEWYQFLSGYLTGLATIFIVSATRIYQDSAPPASSDIFNSQNIAGLSILVSAAPGKKCQRCWMYSETVGQDQTYPTVCRRCIACLS
jgi:isoleucyl-tRNA synthetase